MALNRRKWLVAAFGMASGIPLGQYNNGTPPPPSNPPPNGPAPEKQPANTDGAYLTYVRGYLTGRGQSRVGGGTVNITASVTTADGITTSLTASGLTLTGDHFAGTGTASGCSTLHIVGRLDGYQNDTNFTGARVLAFYTDGNGHNGKLGGVIVP